MISKFSFTWILVISAFSVIRCKPSNNDHGGGGGKGDAKGGGGDVSNKYLLEGTKSPGTLSRCL